MLFFFFFQAEDGIRDWSVTGVQTCALPISAAQLTPVSFELGGKSPFLVFEDADLDAAAATAAYQYDNSGQVCLAGTRLLVQRSVVEPFVERFCARADEIVVGDPRDEATTYGPLIH